MRRLNTVLMVALGLQVLVFGLATLVGGAPTGRTAPVDLLPALEQEAVRALVIEGADGKSIRLERRDGAGWMVASRFGFPADGSKVVTTLGKLLGLQSSYLVARGPDHQASLEVAADKFRRKLTLESPAGPKVLYLGPQRSGYAMVRLDGAEEIYGVEDIDEWQLGLQPRDWLRREVLSLDSERVVELEIRAGDKVLKVTRASRDTWQADGAPVEASRVQPLLSALAKVEANDVVGALGDAAVRAGIDGAKDAVTVTAGLAAAAVPEAPAAAEPDAGVPPTLEPPAVVERRVLHLAPVPDKSSALRLYVEGSDFAVEADRWRLEKLLKAELPPASAAPAGGAPFGP